MKMHSKLLFSHTSLVLLHDIHERFEMGILVHDIYFLIPLLL